MFFLNTTKVYANEVMKRKPTYSSNQFIQVISEDMIGYDGGVESSVTDTTVSVADLWSNNFQSSLLRRLAYRYPIRLYQISKFL